MEVKEEPMDTDEQQPAVSAGGQTIDPVTGLPNGTPIQLDTASSSGFLGTSTSLPDQIFATSTPDVGAGDMKTEDLLMPKTEPTDLASLAATSSDTGEQRLVLMAV